MNDTEEPRSGPLAAAWERVSAIVVHGAIPEHPWPLRIGLSSFRALVLAGMRFERDRGRERAAALAYGTLLALIPIVLLGVSALELIAAPGDASPTQQVLDLVFPARATLLKQGFTDLFEESRAALEGSGGTTAVRIFSVLLLLYFATSLMTSVDRMVTAIWRTARHRSFAGRISSYWAVLTLAPVAVALSFAGTAVAADLLGAGAGAFLANAVRFSVTWVAVFLFYRLMPRTRVRTSAALAGAVVAGSLWEGSKLAMGFFLMQPKTLLTAMTIFPAAMLWLYVTWLILIYGLEVAHVVQQRASLPGRVIALAPPRGLRHDALTLAAAIEVAAAFDAGRQPTRDELATSLGAADDHMRRALGALREAGLVAVGEDGGYRPARGTGGIQVADVIAASRGGEGALPTVAAAPALRVAAECLRSHGESGNAAAGAVSLAELVALRAAAGTSHTPEIG